MILCTQSPLLQFLSVTRAVFGIVFRQAGARYRHNIAAGMPVDAPCLFRQWSQNTIATDMHFQRVAEPNERQKRLFQFFCLYIGLRPCESNIRLEHIPSQILFPFPTRVCCRQRPLHAENEVYLMKQNDPICTPQTRPAPAISASRTPLFKGDLLQTRPASGKSQKRKAQAVLQNVKRH